jgi:hypothetical protein
MGLEKGRALGMPLNEFTEKAWSQLASGTDHVIVGALGPDTAYLEMVNGRRNRFEALSNLMLTHFEL